MKNIFLFIVFFGLSTTAFAQPSAESLIKKGIAYHDEGNYDDAIRMYELALEQEPESEMAYFELSYSYYAKNDLEKAIEYSDILIKKGKDERIVMQAYMTKANALDEMGESKKAIKVYKKAIKANKNEYLLYYNLGLTYMNRGELDKAEENIVQAIDKNPNHGSSHAMLGNLHSSKENKVQSILADAYFLSLEPNSKRSKLQFDKLEMIVFGNVEKGEDNVIIITIGTDDLDSKNPFRKLEVLLSLGVANNTTEYKDSTSDALFAESLKDIIAFVSMDSDRGDELDIWWDLYIPFFKELEREGYLPSFARYISQSGNPDSILWLDRHPLELRRLEKFLRERRE